MNENKYLLSFKYSIKDRYNKKNDSKQLNIYSSRWLIESNIPTNAVNNEKNNAALIIQRNWRNYKNQICFHSTF